MRYLILTIVTILAVVYIFLWLAVEDDRRWFRSFSKAVNQTYFDSTQVNKIADLASIEPPPPVIGFTSVFVKSEGDSIVETRFQNLLSIYVTAYQNRYQKFADFLFVALNGRIKLDTAGPIVRRYCTSIFKIDTVISSVFRKEGINGMLGRYLIPDADFYVLRNPNLSLNEQNSISYFLFLNQIFRERDDYHAKVRFRKFVL